MTRWAFILLVIDLSAFGADPLPVRIATFNIAMGLEQPAQLSAALRSGADERLRQVAEILQRVRPDIVLLNEFDFDPAIDAAAELNDHYLARSQRGQQPIHYEHHFRAPVNTGVDSGLDLDGDGRPGGPGDAWGFGHFPGQYGMLLLSHHPLRGGQARTFTAFRWAALPDARAPLRADGTPFYPDNVWSMLRLSSKSHWDVTADINGRALHLLAFHPTPPVFDGPEDRNGLRNFDEIRFWREYTRPDGGAFIVDDGGTAGGIAAGEAFVIAGDFNADPWDGDATPGAIAQLLEAPWIDARCVPASIGGRAPPGWRELAADRRPGCRHRRFRRPLRRQPAARLPVAVRRPRDTGLRCLLARRRRGRSRLAGRLGPSAGMVGHQPLSHDR